jgi:hypothetical protein
VIVGVQAVRFEDDDGSPVQHLTFMRLAGPQASLQHFRIDAYGDGDASWPIVSGQGSLNAGSILGHGLLNLTGAGSGISAVEIRSLGAVTLLIDGDVRRCSVRSASGGPGVRARNIAVTGELELDDGQGGTIVYLAQIDDVSPAASWAATGSGIFQAAFNGTQMLLQLSTGGGVSQASVVAFADEPKGALALQGSPATGFRVTASRQVVGAKADFSVRRVA